VHSIHLYDWRTWGCCRGIAHAAEDRALDRLIDADSKLCGGGARSPLWRKIFANVLNIALDIPQTEEGPGYGGALLAMVGCGDFKSVADACARFVRVRETVTPDPEIAARYEERYQQFKRIYPSMKTLFKELINQ
jgi:xylulokinase